MSWEDDVASQSCATIAAATLSLPPGDGVSIDDAAAAAPPPPGGVDGGAPEDGAGWTGELSSMTFSTS